MTKHEHYTKRIKDLFEQSEESKSVKNRYRTTRYALYEQYHEMMDLVTKDKMIEFIKDVLYVDRKLRMMTQDLEQEEKKILSQEWCLKNDRLKI